MAPPRTLFSAPGEIHEHEPDDFTPLILSPADASLDGLCDDGCTCGTYVGTGDGCCQCWVETGQGA